MSLRVLWVEKQEESSGFVSNACGNVWLMDERLRLVLMFVRDFVGMSYY